MGPSGCDALLKLSPELEGAFRSKPGKLEMWTPALIIYSAVALAWACVAKVGAVSLRETLLRKEIPVIDGVAAIVPLALSFGFVSGDGGAEEKAAFSKRQG